MKHLFLLMIGVLLPLESAAESLIASRTLRSRTLIEAGDVKVVEGEHSGALRHPQDAIGQETKVVIYAGRPVFPEDLGRPALIERNQIVTLIYEKHGLLISTEGRSLVRAGEGEIARVMNLASKTTVHGAVDAAGHVIVRTNSEYLEGN